MFTVFSVCHSIPFKSLACMMLCVLFFLRHVYNHMSFFSLICLFLYIFLHTSISLSIFSFFRVTFHTLYFPCEYHVYCFMPFFFSPYCFNMIKFCHLVKQILTETSGNVTEWHRCAVQSHFSNRSVTFQLQFSHISVIGQSPSSEFHPVLFTLMFGILGTIAKRGWWWRRRRGQKTWNSTSPDVYMQFANVKQRALPISEERPRPTLCPDVYMQFARIHVNCKMRYLSLHIDYKR